MSKGGFQNPKYANQSGSTSGYGSQGNFGMGYTPPYGGGFGQQFGTYDPMLGFGQASGMGTTYNAPTRYTADYTRFLQSGQPFNPAVMGYNSYGQIFAQPRRQPPPTMGVKGGFKQPSQRGSGKGGGYRPYPPPTMGGKGGRQVGSPGVPSTGFDPEGYFRNRRNNPPSNILKPPPVGTVVGPYTGPIGQTAVGPQPPPDESYFDVNQNQEFRSYPGGSGFLRERPRQPDVERILPDITQPAVMPEYAYPTNQFPQVAFEYNQAPTLVDGLPVGAPPPRESILDQNIANSPFGQLIPQPAQQAGGNVSIDINNPAYQQQLAFQQGNSEEAIRNRIQRELNNAFETSQASGKSILESAKEEDELSKKLHEQYGLSPVLAQQQQMSAGNTFGLGGMPTGGPQIRPDYIPVMGERNFDMQGFNPPSQPFNFDQGFGRMAFQEGGQVPPDASSNIELMLSEAAPSNPQSEMAGEYDRLIQMTMQAILGQVERSDEIIQMFIDEFGVDAFRQLRDAVLKQQVPGAQTEGMVNGNGGGMDDQVMGMIGNQRPVAVSPGEYIVPADVVSGLGDGSSKSGADILDELNQAVRMARTGTTEQPRPLAESMR